jgi:hypothetical protein
VVGRAPAALARTMVWARSATRSLVNTCDTWFLTVLGSSRGVSRYRHCSPPGSDEVEHFKTDALDGLARLAATRTTNAAPPPLPEVEARQHGRGRRAVSPGGSKALDGQDPARWGQPRRPARRDPHRTASLLFFGLDTRELLRTRANPLTEQHALRLRGCDSPDRHRARHSSRSASNAWPTAPE